MAKICPKCGYGGLVRKTYPWCGAKFDDITYHRAHVRLTTPLMAILLVAIVAVMALAGAVEATEGAGDEWPMFRHDPANTGYSPSKTPVHNNLLWDFEMQNEIHVKPAIVDNRVYVGPYCCAITCLDANTGNTIWIKEGDFRESSPTVVNNRVYIGAYSDNFYCLDAGTGKTLWTRNLGGYNITSPKVVGNRVYVGASSGLYALDAEDGEIIWSFDLWCYASPAVVDEKVYVGGAVVGEKGKFYCLDTDDGSVIWSLDPRPDLDYLGWSSPAVAYDKVFAGAGDNVVYAFDKNTGSLVWSYQTPNYCTSAELAVAYNKVFVPHESELRLVLAYETGGVYMCDAYLSALDAETGELVWSYKVDNGVHAFSPVVADNKVFFGDHGSFGVHCLDAYTGQAIWHDHSVCVPDGLAVVNGRLFVGAHDHNLYCFGTPPPVIETPSDGQEVIGAVEVSVIAFGYHVERVELNWGGGWVEAEQTLLYPPWYGEENPQVYWSRWKYLWHVSQVPKKPYTTLRVRAVYDGWYSDENIITLRVTKVPWELGWIVPIFILAFVALYLAKQARRRGLMRGGYRHSLFAH